MPSCVNCGSSTTPAVIEVGDGLEIDGAGTPSAPYRIDLASQSALAAFQVRDSQTINFTFTGSGTDDDPYILSGDTGSATSLTGLADYSDTALPNPGEVVTWVGTSTTGHWASQPIPPAASNTTTDASKLTSGILSNDRLSGVMVSSSASAFSGDFNTLLIPGIYRTTTGTSNAPSNAYPSGSAYPGPAYPYGTLAVFASGTAVSQQFSDAQTGANWVRTKYNASDWTAWARLVVSTDLTAITATGGPTLVATTGDWIVSVQNFWRRGYTLTAEMRFKRNGTAIAAGYGVIHIGDLSAGFGSVGVVQLSGFNATNIGTLHGYVSSTAINLIVGSEASQIRNGDTLILGGTWNISS